jgi:hypothetical protein
VGLEGSGSGSGGFTLGLIGSFLGSNGGGVLGNGGMLGSFGLGLGSESSVVVSHSSFVLSLGSGFFSLSVSEFTLGSSVLGTGTRMGTLGSRITHFGFGGGNLGGVPGTKGMESEGIGGVGSFGGLEVSVDGVSLLGVGFDSGGLGTIVGFNGLLVGSDSSEPFGVPLSLNSDLLSSDVLGVVVDVSGLRSDHHSLHVLSHVLGTGIFSFLEGIESREEVIVGVSGTGVSGANRFLERSGCGCFLGLGGLLGNLLLADVLVLFVTIIIVPLALTRDGYAVFVVPVVGFSTIPVGVRNLFSIGVDPTSFLLSVVKTEPGGLGGSSNGLGYGFHLGSRSDLCEFTSPFFAGFLSFLPVLLVSEPFVRHGSGSRSSLLTDVLGLLGAEPIIPLSGSTPEGSAIFAVVVVVGLSSSPVGVSNLASIVPDPRSFLLDVVKTEPGGFVGSSSGLEDGLLIGSRLDFSELTSPFLAGSLGLGPVQLVGEHLVLKTLGTSVDKEGGSRGGFDEHVIFVVFKLIINSMKCFQVN